MPLLRRLHLGLGCFFAPLLVFFAVSGLWQAFPARTPDMTQVLLSSIHTGRGLKTGEVPNLSSPGMRWLVAAMAVSLILNIGLGLVLAFRSALRRTAAWSFLAGAVAPATLVVLVLWRAARFWPWD